MQCVVSRCRHGTMCREGEQPGSGARSSSVTRNPGDRAIESIALSVAGLMLFGISTTATPAPLPPLHPPSQHLHRYTPPCLSLDSPSSLNQSP